jgi:glutathione S-transferase
MRVLWGAGTGRTMRPHWALHELGLDFECRPIHPRTPEMDQSEFAALTARHKVPLLQDNGVTLTESAAIIWYLSETYGNDQNRLIPTDPAGKAHCLEWCFYIQGELDETSLYVIRRHGDLAETYGEAPAAIKSSVAYFHAQMRTVEQALESSPPFILGERFTAADILLSTCISWAVDYRLTMTEPVLAYNARMTARPAYHKALTTNGSK